MMAQPSLHAGDGSAPVVGHGSWDLPFIHAGTTPESERRTVHSTQPSRAVSPVNGGCAAQRRLPAQDQACEWGRHRWASKTDNRHSVGANAISLTGTALASACSLRLASVAKPAEGLGSKEFLTLRGSQGLTQVVQAPSCASANLTGDGADPAGRQPHSGRGLVGRRLFASTFVQIKQRPKSRELLALNASQVPDHRGWSVQPELLRRIRTDFLQTQALAWATG